MKTQKKSRWGTVETIAGVGFLTILGLWMSRYWIHFHSSSAQSTREIASRDELMNQMKRFAGDALSLDNSADLPGNSDFKNCVRGSNIGCTAGVEIPFQLANSMGVIVAGKANQPQLYDSLGKPCTSLGPHCGIEAIASFKAECPGASPCNIAKSVMVNVMIRQSPSVSKLVASSSFRSVNYSIQSEVPLVLTAVGTPSQLTKWITNSQLGDSVVSEVNGNIGVNDFNPTAKLSVTGDAMISQALTVGGKIHSISGGFQFPNGSVQESAPVHCTGVLQALHWNGSNWSCDTIPIPNCGLNEALSWDGKFHCRAITNTLDGLPVGTLADVCVGETGGGGGPGPGNCKCRTGWKLVVTGTQIVPLAASVSGGVEYRPIYACQKL